MILSFLYLLYTVFSFISIFITAYGAFLVYIAVIISLIRYVIRSLVFPGSNKFIRKMVEYNIRDNMTRIILNTISNLKYTLEEANQEEKITESNAIDLMESISDIRKMIESISTNNSRQRNINNLSTDQQEFQNNLECLQQSISSLRLLKPGENMVNISIWDSNSIPIETLTNCSFSDNFSTIISTLDTF